MFGFLVNSQNSKDANEETTGVSFTMLFNDGVNYDPLNPMKTHSWHKDAKAAGDKLSARVSSTNMHLTTLCMLCPFPSPSLPSSAAIVVCVDLILFCTWSSQNG